LSELGIITLDNLPRKGDTKTAMLTPCDTFTFNDCGGIF